MTDKVYDFLNKLERWLPAIGILYLGICKIWNLPFGDEVSQTLGVIATFLASTLEIATVQYHKNADAGIVNKDGDID